MGVFSQKFNEENCHGIYLTVDFSLIWGYNNLGDLIMSENCNGNCSNCSSDCAEKKSFIEKTGEFNNIKHVIAVVSGKGGVGKSTVTSMLAVELRAKGHSVGILDADITGPSIPKAFGITKKAYSDEIGIIPAESKNGIKIMSINMMLPESDSPVVWRGPVIAGAVKQFWTDVIWGDLDYLLIDCPPGTGDVPLTVFQSLPLDGIIIVSTPQDLVSLIVKKAVNMAKMMNINILGLIENMSFFVCPDCNKKHYIFGDYKDIAEETGLEVLAELPINSDYARMEDNGSITEYKETLLKKAVEKIEKL